MRPGLRATITVFLLLAFAGCERPTTPEVSKIESSAPTTEAAPVVDGTTPEAPAAVGLARASDAREPIAAPQPELAASAPTGRATAYWPRTRQSIDAKTPWRSIARDGIHDRTSEAVSLLQQPRRAFRGFPRANSGNFVDWAAALREGLIKPRSRVGRGGKMEILDHDILLVDTKNMPYVIFPHKTHTEWLGCRNCHDWLFKAEHGANDLSMTAISRGRQCGLCHGRVAFPLQECFRCHSGPRPR